MKRGTGKLKIVFEGTAVRAMAGDRVVARAMYGEMGEKIVQIVELTVPPRYRRRGYGSRVLLEIVKKTRPAKMWVAVGHKTQVVARAFLTKHGFHHISTTSNLLADEDLLIYVKSWV